MARQQLSDLASQAMNQWSLLSVAIVHRMGKVLPQEASIALAVSSPHRAQAFAAAEWIIDQIKRDVAIWKQENYKCSTSEWVHSDDANISQCPPIDVPQTFPPHG
jgi:molybdopterin synthase catalytic subunit